MSILVVAVVSVVAIHKEDRVTLNLNSTYLFDELVWGGFRISGKHSRCTNCNR